jgi:hypothetical protein
MAAWPATQARPRPRKLADLNPSQRQELWDLEVGERITSDPSAC